MQAKSITVIFPMAGEGVRFGRKFKPFLKLGNKTFIELAVNSFHDWNNYINEYVFVYRKSQESKYQVEENLKILFPDKPFKAVQLDRLTGGAAETAEQAIQLINIQGKIIICDCDHSLNVAPLMQTVLTEDAVDSVLPIWDISNEDIKSWAVVSLDNTNRVTEIAEKKYPSTPGKYYGVIGCTYFKSAKNFSSYLNTRHVSEKITLMIADNKNIAAREIYEAKFFGDPQRLEQTLKAEVIPKGTIFCDIDGTIAIHEDIPSYENPLTIISGAIEQLKQWIDEGYTVILVTARSKKDEEKLISALQAAGVPFHDLITGLQSGIRYIINDRKPQKIFSPQAKSIEIHRNEGIQHIQIEPSSDVIIKKFKGGSFVETYLVKTKERLVVRKVCYKRNNTNDAYQKLKIQYNNLKKFNSLAKGITPEILQEHEDNLGYYFDIEFLENYQTIDYLDVERQEKAIKILLNVLCENIYSINKNLKNNGNSWLQTHVSEKITSKLESLQNMSIFSNFLNRDTIHIDGVSYLNLTVLIKKLLQEPYVNILMPKKLSIIHGDLTFENILFLDNQVKIIDMDGANDIDAIELDLGKMFQSVISKYEQWSIQKQDLVNLHKDTFEVQLKFNNHKKIIDLDKIIQYWSPILEDKPEIIKAKGYFYMTLHLIRMIPYRLNVSTTQGLYAFFMAHIYMDEALKKLEHL